MTIIQLIILFIISDIRFSSQHFIPPLQNCIAAEMCNHTWVPICGIDKNSTKIRSFLDECDMVEYNCDYKADYAQTDEEKCRNNTNTDDATKNTNGTTIPTAPGRRSNAESVIKDPDYFTSTPSYSDDTDSDDESYLENVSTNISRLRLLHKNLRRTRLVNIKTILSPGNFTFLTTEPFIDVNETYNYSNNIVTTITLPSLTITDAELAGSEIGESTDSLRHGPQCTCGQHTTLSPITPVTEMVTTITESTTMPPAKECTRHKVTTALTTILSTTEITPNSHVNTTTELSTEANTTTTHQVTNETTTEHVSHSFDADGKCNCGKHSSSITTASTLTTTTTEPTTTSEVTVATTTLVNETGGECTCYMNTTPVMTTSSITTEETTTSSTTTTMTLPMSTSTITTIETTTITPDRKCTCNMETNPVTTTPMTTEISTTTATATTTTLQTTTIPTITTTASLITTTTESITTPVTNLRECTCGQRPTETTTTSESTTITVPLTTRTELTTTAEPTTTTESTTTTTTTTTADPTTTTELTTTEQVTEPVRECTCYMDSTTVTTPSTTASMTTAESSTKETTSENITNNETDSTTTETTPNSSKVTCSAYPRECKRPSTWETTSKGETRDFFRILRERYGDRVRVLRATTHWPLRIPKIKRYQDSFRYGRHNEG